MIQYRVTVSKTDERVDGPADAATVVSVALADAAEDPAVAYMRGRLKVSGPVGPFLAALQSGEVSDTLVRLSSQ